MRAVVYSGDDTNDDSIDDRTECDWDYVEPRNGDSENTEDATSDDVCSNEVDVMTVVFIGEDKAKWG